MSNDIEDEDDDGFSEEDEFEPEEDSNPPPIKGQTDARRRIEELMERRRLKSLLDDPYQDLLDEDL
jgi:hypothetical protein